MSENGEPVATTDAIMGAMTLDADRCYTALRTRDRRFDGRFFVGVSSTGIYCRPVCPARIPRRDRCEFFTTAAAAETRGFRPCLRCRPELAPGNARVDATRSLAARAASLIEDGLFVDGGGVERLSVRLGVSDRHLRRTFQAQFGVSPVEFAQTQRLLLAKRLLTDTRMRVVDVAMASGFASLRRLNTLFQTRYHLSPSDLRCRARTESASDVGFRVSLRYERPFAWRALLRFLRARAVPGVESVDGRSYRRTVRLASRRAEHVGAIDVAHDARRGCVVVTTQPTLASVLPLVVGGVKRLFDLACPVQDVERGLGPLATACPGLRVPGAFDGFEVAVRAILGQQVTVAGASTLAGRLAEAFGDAVETEVPELTRLFPRAERIARLDVETLRTIGLVSTRARAILGLARAVADGSLGLEPEGPIESTLERLRAIPGIGDWTAQYIAMRALAWPDAFPESDLGIRRALGETRPARIRATAEAWLPWRSYAAMHLWQRLDIAATNPSGE